MKIYVFWKISVFKEDILYVLDVPFNYLESRIDEENDMDAIVLNYLNSLGYNLQIEEWGMIDDLKRDILSFLDNKKTLLDVLDNFFDKRVNSNVQLEIISTVLDILEKERKAFIGYDGIIYKTKSGIRSDYVQTAEILKEKLC